MRKPIFIVVLITLVLFGFAKFTQAQKEMKKDKNKNNGGQHLMATLSGAAEVPKPGDADGSGMAHITLNHGKGEVCYDVSAKDIQAPTAAHLHAGVAGQAGAVKVTFKVAADGMWKGCANADKALIKEIMDNPANFYVNVHNAEFPDGAVRGQLAK